MNLKQVGVWLGDPDLAVTTVARWELRTATGLLAEHRSLHAEGELLLATAPREGSINCAGHHWSSDGAHVA